MPNTQQTRSNEEMEKKKDAGKCDLGKMEICSAPIFLFNAGERRGKTWRGSARFPAPKKLPRPERAGRCPEEY
jgi:hypothetical protein